MRGKDKPPFGVTRNQGSSEKLALYANSRCQILFLPPALWGYGALSI